MSPHGGNGDIEQEGAGKISGVKPSGERQDVGKEAAAVSDYKSDRHCSHTKQSRLSQLFIPV